MRFIATACSFTGHRPHKFPWKDHETDPRCTALKSTLAEQIAALTAAGVTDYYSGGADGTDCYAAEVVLSLRKKKSRIEATLCPALQGAGGEVGRHRTEAVLLHFTAGRFSNICKPKIL